MLPADSSQHCRGKQSPWTKTHGYQLKPPESISCFSNGFVLLLEELLIAVKRNDHLHFQIDKKKLLSYVFFFKKNRFWNQLTNYSDKPLLFVIHIKVTRCRNFTRKKCRFYICWLPIYQSQIKG